MDLPPIGLDVRHGSDRGQFPRSPRIDRQVRCPALPRQHRHAYAADFQRGLPTDEWSRLRSRPPTSTGGRALRPAQIRQVRAGVVITGRQALISRVHLPVSLAGPGSSGSTNPSRRCRGCLPLSSTSPEPNCPQLQPDCYDNPAVKVSHLTRFHGASWRTHSLRQARLRFPRHRDGGSPRNLAPVLIRASPR